MRSVVLLSGGLDSAVAAALEAEQGHEVWPVWFRYGQRHAERERLAMHALCQRYGWWNRCAVLGLDHLGGSSLTGLGELVGPAVVVPERNLIFLAMASHLGCRIEADRLVIGCNAADHALFPDCRAEYLARLSGLLSVPVHAPLVELDKRAIVAEARRLGVPIELTWSCYAGGDAPCGTCGACQERDAALEGLR